MIEKVNREGKSVEITFEDNTKLKCFVLFSLNSCFIVSMFSGIAIVSKDYIKDIK